jgi:hypothetical protein
MHSESPQTAPSSVFALGSFSRFPMLLTDDVDVASLITIHTVYLAHT